LDFPDRLNAIAPVCGGHREDALEKAATIKHIKGMLLIEICARSFRNNIFYFLYIYFIYLFIYLFIFLFPVD
jgi:hypothetical protein